MTTYTALCDTLRLLWLQKRDHIAAYRKHGEKAGTLAAAHLAMDGLHVSQLDALAAGGRVLAAVAAAHERDPDALAAVIGEPLSGPSATSAHTYPNVERPSSENRSAGVSV